MQNIISKIDELNAILKKMLPMKTDFQDILDKKFRLEFNYNSNHLEGNTLTYNETELLLIFDETKGNHTLREYNEMKAHDVATELIKEWASDKETPLSETIIKQLNKVILYESFWKEAITPDGNNTRRQIKVGDYKEFPNSVQLSNGEIFEYASVTDTPILMRDLLQWYKTKEQKKELHPVALAAMLHYKFVRIHPFDDGNGRISRLLMNYVLYKNNLPPVVIKTSDKRNYLSSLRSADVGDINTFINYIAEQLMWSLNISIKAARGENIAEEGDFDKEITVFSRSMENAGDEIKKAKNEEVMNEMLKETVLPLYRKVFAETLKLSHLFIETRFEFLIDGSGGEHQNINDMTDDIEICWEQKKGNIDSIKLKVQLYKFKILGTKAFDINDEITIIFEKYKYQIVLQQNETEEYLYHKHISKKTLDEIATRFVKNIFSRVEKQAKEITKKS